MYIYICIYPVVFQLGLFFTTLQMTCHQPSNLPLVAGEAFGMAFVSFLHPRNLTCRHQKLPCWKGVTFSKPSFWVSMVVFGSVFISISSGVFLGLILRDRKERSHFVNHWLIIEWSLIIHDPPGYWLIIGHHGWIINTKWRRSCFHAVCMIGFKLNQFRCSQWGKMKRNYISQKYGTVHRNFHGSSKRNCPLWDTCTCNKTQISKNDSQVCFGYFFWIFLLRYWLLTLCSTFLDQNPHGFSKEIFHLETWLEHLPKTSPRNSLVAQVPLRKKSL